MALPRMPDPGNFDTRVTLQQRAVAVSGSTGARIETWEDLATVWAEARPTSGKDLIAAAAMQAEATVRFRIRWRADVTAAMRVLWRGVPHDILGQPVDREGGRHTLELLCKVGTGAG